MAWKEGWTLDAAQCSGGENLLTGLEHLPALSSAL
jgi:hypothetical protein